MSYRNSPALTQTRVQLGNVKIAEFASEETICISATVLFDGHRIGEASNEGRGGATVIRQMNWDDERVREAIRFSESLPPDVGHYTGSDGKAHEFSIDMCLEYIVDRIVGNIADERRFRRMFNRDMSRPENMDLAPCA